MAYDKQKVLDIALAEEGYLEKASKTNLDDKTANAGDGNNTKYARDLAAVSYFNGNKQGVAWCATFVCWCFYKAFGKAAALKLLCQPSNTKNNTGAGCKYARNFFKAKGQLHDTPQVGDQAFFYSSDKSSISHTGLVYKVDGKKVYTIEGNTSSASGVVANGGAVAKKSYALTYARLAGFGRPDYGTQPVKQEAPQEAEKAPVSVPETTEGETITYTVKKGDTLWKIAQKQLGNGNRYKDIQRLNGLSGEHIAIGQKLKIPKKASSATSTATATTTYTVKKGDSLWKIARAKLGNPNRYKEIEELNGISGDLIRVGQVLKIPKA